MKKVCLLLVVTLLFTVNLEAKKINGKILFENETIDVIFNIPIKYLTQEPIYEIIQYKVKYYNLAGKKFTIKPDNAKEIQFEYGNKNIRMLSINNSLGLGTVFSKNNNIFLKVIIDGNLKMFTYYFTQSSSGVYRAPTGAINHEYANHGEMCIFQKSNGEFKKAKVLTFIKDMVEYFSDCPELAEKIENKVFLFNDMNLIAKFYNKSCH